MWVCVCKYVCVRVCVCVYVYRHILDDGQAAHACGKAPHTLGFNPRCGLT